MATRTPPEGPSFPENSTTGAIARLKEEIAKLNHKHSDALKAATFVGMTPAESREHDERRRLLRLLVQQLAALECAE